MGLEGGFFNFGRKEKPAEGGKAADVLPAAEKADMAAVEDLEEPPVEDSTITREDLEMIKEVMKEVPDEDDAATNSQTVADGQTSLDGNKWPVKGPKQQRDDRDRTINPHNFEELQ